MANKPLISTKRLAISKANARIVIVVSVASFIVVFCLVAANSLLSQNKYQAKVAGAKEAANTQLDTNIKSFEELVSAYKSFNGNDKNVIGGARTGIGDNDGNNAKIVLDSLPSGYDFPALTSTVEKILKDKNLKVDSITGTDDQAAQDASTASDAPEAVPMPFTVTVSGASYASVQTLVDTLEKSIRPMVIDTLNLSGGSSDMTVTVNAHTYFKPAKTLTINKQVVK